MAGDGLVKFFGQPVLGPAPPPPEPEEKAAGKKGKRGPKALAAPAATPTKKAKRPASTSASSPASPAKSAKKTGGAVGASPGAKGSPTKAGAAGAVGGAPASGRRMRGGAKGKVQAGRTAAWGILRRAGMRSPKSVYSMWCGDNRKRIARDLGLTEFGDISRATAEEWAKVSEEAKAPYTKQRQQALVKFLEAKAAYKEYSKNLDKLKRFQAAALAQSLKQSFKRGRGILAFAKAKAKAKAQAKAVAAKKTAKAASTDTPMPPPPAQASSAAAASPSSASSEEAPRRRRGRPSSTSKAAAAAAAAGVKAGRSNGPAAPVMRALFREDPNAATQMYT